MYPPRSGVPGSWEQHHVGAGNSTQSSEKQHSILTAELNKILIGTKLEMLVRVGHFINKPFMIL